VLTKIDLPHDAARVTGVATSSSTGDGLHALERAIVQRLDELPGREYLAMAPTAIRCRDSLRRAGEALRQSQELVDNQMGQELVAAEIRLALDELGKTVGAVYTEDILDRIFGRFCIGK
jgi:tRNA modification GTPase